MNDDPQGHLLEDDPGIYLDLLAERDEAIEKAGRLQARVVELEDECDEWQRKVADLWSESLRREAEIGRLKNEVVRLDDLIASGPNYVDEIERLRALVADIRRLHDSPLHQSFAGSCDGCEALAEFDEPQSPEGATHTDADLQDPKTGHE